MEADGIIRNESLKPTEVPSGPWKMLGTDI
jgi:hypothetical protein